MTPDRLAPYRNYRFIVFVEGRAVAGVSRVSGLTNSSDEKNAPAPSVTLERGVSYDVAFIQWLNKVWDYSNSNSTRDSPAGSFVKEIGITVYNEAGQPVVGYIVHRCWPSEFRSMPELDGVGNAVVIEVAVLQNEGWERDASVGEPTEPTYTLPG
ncbi:MAG TPA: phage tail protein [Gemmatimonadaceae bacterium]|nr:phage tail protein [Gemmatimonadaceae bacterium]